jgi:hypothetical protein
MVQHQVERSGAFGHPLTMTLTDSVTIGDRRTKFKHGRVAASVPLEVSNRTLGLRPVILDRRVRSPRGRHSEEPNGSILWGCL